MLLLLISNFIFIQIPGNRSGNPGSESITHQASRTQIPKICQTLPPSFLGLKVRMPPTSAYNSLKNTALERPGSLISLQ
ncbi:uncharacterized protein TOL2_C30560 [Desulfobacula toluolica Tol2]|uniref:Uncharacterized protein n=1 Tax=Desulfobacula toluolica (strain DSM 7467 / Tol2) TaxID=651182 RepID=K0NK29_DESTT|nr:uncharacterized protein TOL2_C30560 [Desulfobacula toluolica Tol2]